MRLSKCRGWCNKHYLRYWKHGHPDATLIVVGNDAARWHSKVRIGWTSAARPDLGECWLWAGGFGSNGYGQFALGGVTCVAHRVGYEMFCGRIPPGLHLDHLCRVRACVRPSHLDPVTPAENVERVWRGRTCCKSGHRFTTATTYISPQGRRYCRVCQRQRHREWVARQSAALAATL